MGAIRGLGCFSCDPLWNKDAKNCLADISKPGYLQWRLKEQDFPPSDDTDTEAVLLRKILCVFKLLYMSGCDLFKDELQTKIEKLQHSISKASW